MDFATFDGYWSESDQMRPCWVKVEVRRRGGKGCWSPGSVSDLEKVDGLREGQVYQHRSDQQR